MFKEDTYIKSIEKYFLTHLGKGIMLSYSDYELIQSWKDREIPTDIIIEGIREAFCDPKNFDSLNNESRIRNLGYIISYIDKSIEIYCGLKRIETSNDNTATESYIEKIVDKINKSIDQINDKKVLSEVNLYKESLINISSQELSDSFTIIGEKELNLYNKIFNLLSRSEKNTIMTKAKSKIKNSDNMTEDAYNKSVTSFRNMLIKYKFNLEFLN
ncbi:MAG: hypothetical protein GWO07_03505 [Candidatus Dadabacteria bacterium]|nr:hypothetical protein [Candidatus Dadabacteria bacterium]NIS07831.1 hypothetical protein [Candidatus Dadabacteria bacterium]NIV42785.1 hypothetical protein [Candidatus Dadabacteria bacterium]NIX14850.1 hypothetical protein [Candidatus Dadabacteria bacterium]NIY21450.1 hypothetical protein [Candidatus Dadabacteria bacterium]